MSKLKNLIAQLCPNGVEFKPIKDIFTRLRGTSITATKMKEIANPNGDIRIFAGGKTVINAFKNDIPNANIINVPAVLVQSRGIIDFIFYEKPFTFKNEMWAYTNDEKISVKFLYYVLKNNVKYFRDSAAGMGSLPQISLSVTEDFQIPIPPLAVQAEIVRILDTFTELTAKLTTELTAELALRKKQYEYYRDLLLTFDGGGYKVEYKPLGEIAEMKRGTSITKKISVNGVYPVISGGREPAFYCNQYNREGETISVAGSGAGAGFVQFWNKPIFVCDAFSVKGTEKILTKFIYYCLTNLQENIYATKKGGGVPHVHISSIENFKIPIPPLEEQERIVAILDRFDKLCNDLSEGIPAEIALRKKQYEYYRDKLLTFEEAK